MTEQKTNPRKVVFNSFTGHFWSHPVVTVLVKHLTRVFGVQLDEAFVFWRKQFLEPSDCWLVQACDRALLIYITDHASCVLLLLSVGILSERQLKNSPRTAHMEAVASCIHFPLTLHIQGCYQA